MRRRITLVLAALGTAAVILALGSSSGAASQGPAPAAATRPLAAGAELFAATCASCHGKSADGGFTAPGLHGMPLGDQTIADVADIVRSGFGDMKSFSDKLSEAEITEVATYVVTEWGAEGDVATGGELFRLNCAGCHGAAGRGGALIYSEQNAPSLADGSNAITVGAIRGGPGTMPEFNEATLDNASVASIALYVGVLRDPAQPGGLAVAPAGPVTEGLLAGLIGLGAALVAAAWVTRGGRG
jgi:quinol---cytochrome-c reductase cytochrome c subunit